MQEMHHRVSDKFRDCNLPDLPLRIGISTDQVTAGELSPHLNYTVADNAITRAQHLQAACKSTGTAILPSPRTAELVCYLYDLRPISLPRTSDSGVAAYEVLATLSQDSRLALA